MNFFNSMTNTPTLESVLNAFEHYLFTKLNCMKIGIIDEILPDNEVKCLITNKKLMKVNDDGTGVWKDYPPIYAKVWYMGSATTGINYPLTKNSPCLLLFNDREFNSYFTTGEISTLSDLRMHDLSYCIAIPLYRVSSGTDFNITAVGGTININATNINLNAETININGELVINGTPYLDHVHSNGNNGANTGGIVS